MRLKPYAMRDFCDALQPFHSPNGVICAIKCMDDKDAIFEYSNYFEICVIAKLLLHHWAGRAATGVPYASGFHGSRSSLLDVFHV